MARAIITLEDGEQLGVVTVDLDFGCEVDLNESGTPAQHAAMEMIKRFHHSDNVSEMELLPYGDTN